MMNHDYSYDGSGGGGGGFLDSSFSSQKKNGGRRDKQCVIPVTINQLHAATREANMEEPFFVDQTELSTIQVVGLILSMEHHSTSVNISLQDTTGTMDVKIFLHGEDSDGMMDQDEGEAEHPYGHLHEGQYVSVVGSLRTYQGRVNIAGFGVQVVSDMNQVTHHLLRVIYVHLTHTRGRLNADGKTSSTTPMKMSSNPAGGNADAFRTPTQKFSGMAMHTPGGMDDTTSDMSNPQTMVLEALGGNDSDAGVSISDVTNALRGKLNGSQIKDALNYLINEGHVYSTIDEDHYKRTE